MASAPITQAMAAAAHALVLQHGSISGAAKAAGCSRMMLAGRYRAAVARFGMPEVRPPSILFPDRPKPGRPLAPPPAPEGFVITRVGVQTDADGQTERQWITSKPPPGAAFAPLPGHVIKGESALVDAEGRTIARWVKTREGSAPALIEGLQEAFAAHAGGAGVAPVPAIADADLLTLYPLPDLHLGMYAWGRETGDAYDVGIATRRALDSVDVLIGQSRPSAHAVVLGLGDYFHANDHRAATPRSNHALDVDGRWPKVFAAGAQLAIGIIDRALRKHQAVEVRFLPGNHDPDAAVCLTVALALFYADDPRVTVDDDPGLVWYRRHGVSLIGATHGHTMRADRMAMMMAADRPEDWGETWCRVMFSGHVHHEGGKEVGPVRVESLGTPAARDAYAQGAGFRSGRAMQAMTYHLVDGEIGRHRVNLAPRVRGRAA